MRYYIIYWALLFIVSVQTMESGNSIDALRVALDAGDMQQVKSIWKKKFAHMSAFNQHMCITMSIKSHIDTLSARDQKTKNKLKELFPSAFMQNDELFSHILNSPCVSEESDSLESAESCEEDYVIKPIACVAHEVLGDHENEKGFVFELDQNGSKIVFVLVVSVCAAIVGGKKMYTRYHAWRKREKKEKQTVLQPYEQNIKIMPRQKRVLNGLYEIFNPKIIKILKKLQLTTAQRQGTRQLILQRQRSSFRYHRA